MNFQDTMVVLFSVAVLFFLYVRRRIIADLKTQNAELTHQNKGQARQIDHMAKAMHEYERKRQMAELTKQAPAQPSPPGRQASMMHMAAQQEAAIKRDRANTWHPSPNDYFKNAQNLSATTRPSGTPDSDPLARAMMDLATGGLGVVRIDGDGNTVRVAPEEFRGGGGSFDGGGASGDYTPAPSSCSPAPSSDSSYSSSDSGSSSSCSSSDSGSSSSSD